jgi:hypothetical protein
MLIRLIENVENVGEAGRTANVGKEQAHKLIKDGKAQRYVAPAYRPIPGAHDKIQFQHRIFILHDTGDHLAGDVIRCFDDECNWLIQNQYGIAERGAGPQTAKKP